MTWLGQRLRSNLRTERLVFWATAALLSFAILYPAWMSVYAALTDNGAFSFGGFERALKHPSVGKEIVTTLLFAAGSTIGATVIGVPLAWINARTDVRDADCWKSSA